MADVLLIDLNERWAECWACGADTPSRWGLPIDSSAELVPNDYQGDWGGVPACKSCFDAHAQGLLTADNQHEWRKRGELIRRAKQASFVRD